MKNQSLLNGNVNKPINYMREAIFQNLVNSIVSNTNIPKEEINIHSSFEDLGMDSLDSMSVINNLENIYDVTLPNEEVLKIRTVSSAVEALEKFVGQKQLYAKE